VPPVYLDGIELADVCNRLVMRAMGTLSETCGKCGGSMLQVRGVFLRSDEDPAMLTTWCKTCGNYDRVNEFFPAAWHRRILKQVG
jgi:RNase P subunit RPR2